MSELEKTVPPENRPKEPISEKEIGNLLAAVGNNETKAMTLLVMQAGIIYPRYDLHRTFMRAQGNNPGWKTNRSVQFQYCEQTLAPIGLVAKETLNSDLSTYGYQITEYGQEIGIPLAGLLLDFSRIYENVSLRDIFGSTSSKYPLEGKDEEMEIEEDVSSGDKKRAPGTRLKILWELVTNDKPLRLIDIAHSNEEEFSIKFGSHLRQLAKSGIVSYQVREHSKPFTIYILNQVRPKSPYIPYTDMPVLAQKVYSVMEKHPDKRWIRSELTEAVLNEHPELYDGRKTLSGSINQVLSDLRRQRYVIIDKFSNEMQSEISLTPEQRSMITDLLMIIDGVQRRDPATLEKGRVYAAYFLTHPEVVADLMIKAKEHSPGANANSQKTLEEVLAIIRDQPAITSVGIVEMLEARFGRRLTTKTIGSYLSTLQEKQLIKQMVKKVPTPWILSFEEDEREDVSDSNEIQELQKRGEQVEFPNDLHRRLVAIFNTFNAGPKAVTHLLIPPDGSFISFSDLQHKFDEILQDSTMKVTRTYCEYSLYPNGLVSKQYITNPLGYEKNSGFSITEAGVQYGIPVAALGLYFEMQNKIGLYDIFGGKHKYGTYERASLLLFLSSLEQGIAYADLRRRLGIDEILVSLYTRALRSAGIIDFSGESGREVVRITEPGLKVVNEYLHPLIKLLQDDQETRDGITGEILPLVIQNLAAYAENSVNLYYPHSISSRAKKN